MRVAKVTYTVAAWCMMLAMMLTGCSVDYFKDYGEEDEGNFMQLRLVMKSPHTTTRATDTSNPTGGETGDGLRPGNYNENSIYSIYLYQFNSPLGINAPDETEAVLLAYDENVNFKPTIDDVNADKSIDVDINMNVGNYKYSPNDQFIAVVNTKLYMPTTTLGALRNEQIAQTWEQKGTQAKDCDIFVMSNSGESQFEGGNGTKTNPLTVSIDVERIAARVDFAYSKEAKDEGRFRIAGGIYIYKVQGTNDEVMLSHVKVTNAKQQGSYLIKRLASSETDAPRYLADESNPASKYVVEPHTWMKTQKALQAGTLPVSTWYSGTWHGEAVRNYNSTTAPWFTDRDKVRCGSGDAFSDGTTLDTESNDWHYYVLDYVNENTMLASETLQDYTTGIILKATYKPEKVYKAFDAESGTLDEDNDYTTGTTFWRCHGIDSNTDLYFSTLAGAEAYKAEHPQSVVFAYDNAQCYYNVWLRHENILYDPTTTMMEFGIVRNNIYRVCVDFTGIGMPDIPDDMTTPETIRMYIYVRKWNLIQHPSIEI